MKRCTPLLLAFLLLSLTAFAHACPNCKDSIPFSTADDVAGPPKGINTSVYLMLGAFLSVLGFILWTIIKAVRATPAQPPSPEHAFPVAQPTIQQP